VPAPILRGVSPTSPDASPAEPSAPAGDALRAPAHTRGGAEALAALLFRTAGVGVAFVDRALRYLGVNDALAAMNGVAAVAHEGRPLRDVIPLPAFAALEPLLRGVHETGEPVIDLPFDADTPRGRRRFLSSYHPVLGADGETTGLVTLVSEHSPGEVALRESLRENEAQLRTREAQLFTVLQHLPVGVVIGEAPSGRLVHANMRTRRRTRSGATGCPRRTTWPPPANTSASSPRTAGSTRPPSGRSRARPATARRCSGS
jgi:hypothetical protein